MTSCVVDSCCGCVQLRTGCLVIGYLELVAEFILIVFGLMGVVSGEAMANRPEHTSSSVSSILANMTARSVGGLVLAVSVVMLVFVFVLLVFTVVLLVGVHQNKRGYVNAYLIYSYVFLVIAIIGFFFGFVGTIKVQMVLLSLAIILLGSYFTLVVRSHHHEMDDKRPLIYNYDTA